MKVEMRLHICMLTSYLAEAKALVLQEGERTGLLEVAINAENEIESLRAMAGEAQEEDDPRAQPTEKPESQSSE